MPKYFQSKGKCRFCDKEFGKSGISRHLEACPKRRATCVEGDEKFFHLHIAGTYAPFYWLNIELPGRATLADLDNFLRAIWLECCGHLSAFRIDGQRYLSHPEAIWNHADTTMDIKLDPVLAPGLMFEHEYDFGTTTYLTLKVVGERQGKPEKKKADLVRILARNNPPEILCGVCEERNAQQICAPCSYSPEGWLCDVCVKTHACGDEMLLPVVNSPRTGECGYDGPYDPRYR